MEKEPFKIDGITDRTDEELTLMMEQVGEVIREETLKVKQIHER